MFTEGKRIYKIFKPVHKTNYGDENLYKMKRKSPDQYKIGSESSKKKSSVSSRLSKTSRAKTPFKIEKNAMSEENEPGKLLMQEGTDSKKKSSLKQRK